MAFEHEGTRQIQTARVVIGADGRASQVRAWGGFEVLRNPDLLTIAGTLMQDTEVPDDAVHLVFGRGCASLIAPLGNRRARMYYVYPGNTRSETSSWSAKSNFFSGLF